MKSSLEHKTVRPGSLNDYSFYYSNRTAPQAAEAPAKPARKLSAKLLVIAALLVLVGVVAYNTVHKSPNTSVTNVAPAATSSPKSTVATGSKPKTKATTTATNQCAGNSLDKFIRVSVSQRHLWACSGTKVAYDTAVITGMEKHAATETPLGTYKIYAKQTNVTLTGSDETGSWSDPVYYWMPFLDNQYGTYGFHDATWRNPNEFGHVDAATSDDASHGCVELPLGASQWLYNWAAVGTTLTVEA